MNFHVSSMSAFQTTSIPSPHPDPAKFSANPNSITHSNRTLCCLSTACQSGSALEVPVDGYGELSSPGFPYDIPEHINCRWLLRAADNMVRVTMRSERRHTILKQPGVAAETKCV